MASYLATASIGEFLVRHLQRRRDHVTWDAIDPDLFERRGAAHRRPGRVSQTADLSYKRLTRTISVPAGGATMTFWVSRSTETDWDYFFVEARTPAATDWTTLPEASGHTDQHRQLLPVLAGASTRSSPATRPTTATALRPRRHPTDRRVARRHGRRAGVAAVDDRPRRLRRGRRRGLAGLRQRRHRAGAGRRDRRHRRCRRARAAPRSRTTVTRSTGGRCPGPPAGSPGNANDWIAAGQDHLPASVGDIAVGITRPPARDPAVPRRVLRRATRSTLLAASSTTSPTSASPWRTRRGRSTHRCSSPTRSPADAVVVHELTHQWFGDDLRLGRWKDIWLNEGFATYAEWLWSEHEGLGSPQEQFDGFMTFLPADDPFWTVPIGDPGPTSCSTARCTSAAPSRCTPCASRSATRLLRDPAHVGRRESGEAVSTPEFIASPSRSRARTSTTCSMLGCTPQRSRTSARSLLSPARPLRRASPPSSCCAPTDADRACAPGPADGPNLAATSATWRTVQPSC